MNRIAFYGSLWTSDYTVVVDLIGKWVKTTHLDIKLRLSGEEIVYEDERFYLYCYNAVSSEGVDPSFLLEGNLAGTLDEAGLMLQELAQLCTNHYVAGDFEYVEVNEEGDEVSEQCSLTAINSKLHYAYAR